MNHDYWALPLGLLLVLAAFGPPLVSIYQGRPFPCEGCVTRYWSQADVAFGGGRTDRTPADAVVPGYRGPRGSLPSDSADSGGYTPPDPRANAADNRRGEYAR